MSSNPNPNDTSPIAEQINRLTTAIVDGQDSGEDYSAELEQLNRLQQTAIEKRNEGATEPIDLPADVEQFVSKWNDARQSDKLRRSASAKLKAAVEQVGGIPGSEEFFTSRLVQDDNGTVQVRDDNGNPRPINRDTVAEMLPNSLKKTRRALESDELQDLLDTRNLLKDKVAKLRGEYGTSGGDSGVMSRHREASQELRETEARIEDLKKSRAQDRQGPKPLSKVAPPAVISKFAQLSGACEREAKAYHSSGGQDYVSFQRWQSYKKQMRRIKAEYPGI